LVATASAMVTHCDAVQQAVAVAAANPQVVNEKAEKNMSGGISIGRHKTLVVTAPPYRQQMTGAKSDVAVINIGNMVVQCSEQQHWLQCKSLILIIIIIAQQSIVICNYCP